MDKEQLKTFPKGPHIANIEKIVDYTFEKSEKSNVLAIDQTRNLIAYLLDIQIPSKISKGWTSGVDVSPSSSINGGQGGPSDADKHTTVCIRIIDYKTRQRCLAKGVYYARPADCAFIINSLIYPAKTTKLGVVDQLANVYLYDLSCSASSLTATRIVVIRGFGQDSSPYKSINLVWCPFVPCEDFDDGDGGLRLALSTDTKIEIFAVDRLQNKTGEIQRSDLKGAYKCIQDAHTDDIVSLSISPDCSTISSAARDNRVTFFSSDIDDGAQRPLHNWDANIHDGSKISKLFFLDDYPKLLEDSSLKFWGSAFIGTTSGLMLLIDLREWRTHQQMYIPYEGTPQTLNFDYRIDLSSRNIVAINGNQCYMVQIAPDYRNIYRTTRLILHFPVYSFVIKNKSEDELELFTISAYSLEKYIITLSKSDEEKVAVEQDQANVSASLADMFNLMSTSVSFQAAQPSVTPAAAAILASAGGGSATHSPRAGHTSAINNNSNNNNNHHSSKTTAATTPTATTTTSATRPEPAERKPQAKSAALATAGLDVNQMDRLVDALFNKLNTSFSEGLEEFLNDIKSEVNDLKLKLNGLSRDVRKLNQQLQETRQR